MVVRGSVDTELLKGVASKEPAPLFEARELAAAGAFQPVRGERQGIARGPVLALNQMRFGGRTQGGGRDDVRRMGPVSSKRPRHFQHRPRQGNGCEARTCFRTEGDGDAVQCDEAQ